MTRPQRPALHLFLAANLALTFANGVQLVLFAWLVTQVLGETPSRVGLAQAAMMAPGLVLILIGGLVADRIDGRRLLPPLHWLGAVPIAAVAAALAADALSYPLMIGYAVVMGGLGAFLGPARDAMLNRVAQGSIQHTVTLQHVATYGGQLAGFALASVPSVGPLWLLGVQASALGCAGIAFAAMRPPAPHSGELGGRSGRHEILDALRATWSSRRLRAALLVQLAVGILLAGTWTVLLQLLVRDVYGGGRGMVSVFYSAMMIGTLIGTLGMAARGGVRRMGVALVGGLTVAAAGASLMGTAPPLPLAFVAIALWGSGGSVTIVLTKTIAQESAPPTQRARVLSLFQLAVIGGAPFGAYASGVAAARLGTANAVWLPAAGLLLVVAIALLGSDLVRIVAEGGDANAGEDSRERAAETG